MTTQITWTISQLDCYPQADGVTDVVFTVHWRCNGIDGTYGGTTYGSCGVTVDPAEPFTDFADLTLDQVLGWVWASGVDKDANEAAVAAQIEGQINPTVVTPPLPWGV